MDVECPQDHWLLKTDNYAWKNILRKTQTSCNPLHALKTLITLEKLSRKQKSRVITAEIVKIAAFMT